MDGNWIKVNRQILESNVFEDAKTFKVFMWILLNANYKKRTLINGLTLDVGQLCTSRERISNACDIPQTSIYRIIKRLEKCNSIVTKADRRGTMIDVVNYRVFQHGDEISGRKVGAKRAQSGRKVGAEEELKKVRREELSICPQSDGLQTVNGSKGRIVYSAEFEKFWQAFPSRRKTKKRKSFADFKKAIKRVDVATLMTAVEEYARSNKGRGEYCQQPTTWLNGDCWEDDRASWNEGTPLPSPKRKKTQAEIEAQIRSRELLNQLDELKSHGLGMTDEAEAIKQQMEAIEI